MNADQVVLLRGDPERWNMWRADHPDLARPDLYLNHVNLRGALLTTADFTGANLDRAVLPRTPLLEGQVFLRGRANFTQVGTAV